MITQVYNPQPKDVLRLEFMIGNTCNYSCWYCFEGSHEGTHRWTNDLDQLVANFVHLFDRYKAIGKRKLELHIVGGEPTLWPQLGEFVEEIRKQIFSSTVLNDLRICRVCIKCYVKTEFRILFLIMNNFYGAFDCFQFTHCVKNVYDVKKCLNFQVIYSTVTHPE